MTNSTNETEGLAGPDAPRQNHQAKVQCTPLPPNDADVEGNDDDGDVGSTLSYEEIVRQLTTRLTVEVEVAGAAFGLGRGGSYKAARSGDLPARRMGHKLTVPTAPLRAMLGIDESGKQVWPARTPAASPAAPLSKPNPPNRKARRASPR
jgi:hypothetical protein